MSNIAEKKQILIKDKLDFFIWNEIYYKIKKKEEKRWIIGMSLKYE